ncbi:MAG: chloride channel protein [Acidimicrobiia bacterium]
MTAEYASTPGEGAPSAHRWRHTIVLAVIIGVTTGYVVAGFERLSVEVLFDRITQLPLWCIAIAPSVGLTLAAVIRVTIGRGVGAATADEYLHAFHDPAHRLDVRGGISRLAAAVATLGAGAPMGLEGPSLFAGSTMGALLHRRLPTRWRPEDARTLLVAGAAAGVAAIFKAPATGVVFALEVPYRDDLARRMLLPCLVAASTAYLAFTSVNGTTPLFQIAGEATFSFADIAGSVALGLAAGLVARGFAALIRGAKSFSTRSPWLRVPLAGGVLAVLFVIGRIAAGENLAVGSGYGVIAWALTDNRGIGILAVILAVRCAGTAAAVAGGGSGGLFIPLVVGGTLLGRLTAAIVSSGDPTLFTVVGAAAFLGAGYRVPLAGVVFIAESTGRPGFVVPGLLAAVAAELVMGKSSVTAYQRG